METAIAGSCIDDKISTNLGCGYHGNNIRSAGIRVDGLDLCCCDQEGCNTRQFAELCTRASDEVPMDLRGLAATRAVVRNSTNRDLLKPLPTITIQKSSPPREIDKGKKFNDLESKMTTNFNGSLSKALEQVVVVAVSKQKSSGASMFNCSTLWCQIVTVTTLMMSILSKIHVDL